MARARVGLARNAMGSLAIVGVLALIAVVLPLVDRSLPATRRVVAGAPYVIGAGVSVVPPPGAELDVTRTRPGRQRGAALFRLGGERVAVVVAPFRGSLADATDRIRVKIINSGTGFQLIGPTHPDATDMGVTGARGGYRSPGRFGEYAVFVDRNLAVEVTASVPDDQRQPLAAAMEVSLSGLDFGGR
jgi:hypothetical protein